MKRFGLHFMAGLVALICLSSTSQGSEKKAGYTGAPFQDSRYRGGPQSIPGRVYCAYYDLGGEGIAFHDTDAKNNGSGALNPADGSYLHEFRKQEGVDTSYTKFRDEIDNNPFNLVTPEKDQLYVGWTEPGEWFRMTVSIQKSGIYSMDLLYTSNRGGTIAFDLDGRKLGDNISILSTANDKEPLPWRQWHHWNRMEKMANLKLPQGKHVLTLHVVDKGNFNFAYLDFYRQK